MKTFLVRFQQNPTLEYNVIAGNIIDAVSRCIAENKLEYSINDTLSVRVKPYKAEYKY